MSASPQRRGFLFYSSIPTRSCSISSLICLPACRRGAATAPVTVSEALSRSWWSSPERIRVSSCARTDGSSRGWPWQRVTLDPLACAPVFLGLADGRPRAGSGPLLRSRVRGLAQKPLFKTRQRDFGTSACLSQEREYCQTTILSIQNVALLCCHCRFSRCLPSCLPWKRSGSVSYSRFYEQAT